MDLNLHYHPFHLLAFLFDVDELQHAIEKIPATKAVPHCFPPGPYVEISGTFPCHLAFLSNWNAGGVHLHLSFLRLGRMHGHVGYLNHTNLPPRWKTSGCWDSKNQWARLWLQLITSKALTSCFQTLCRWPQYAYLPCRSTRDALLRAASHCQAVRTLLSSQSRSVAFNLLPHNLDCHVQGAFNYVWILPGLLMLYPDLSLQLHLKEYG